MLYPYYGKPYATLMKMYFLFGDYDKIQEILQISEENKIESDELTLLKGRWIAATAKKVEDLEKALELFDLLKQKGWSVQSDMEESDWEQVEYGRKIISDAKELWVCGKQKEALELIQLVTKYYVK